MIYRFVCAATLALLTTGAAAENLGFDGGTPLEKAQLEVLKNYLREFAGIEATVRFTSEFLSPLASYNRINDTMAAILNLARSKERKVLGAGAREVIVDSGAVAYRCQALVQFRGGIESGDLEYAALNGCAGFLTRVAGERDTQCMIARNVDAKASCPSINFVLPSALRFEIRRASAFITH